MSGEKRPNASRHSRAAAPAGMAGEKALREFTLLRNSGVALLVAAFAGPGDEAAHARALAPNEAEETARVEFAGVCAKERLHAPLQIWTSPRPQAIAFRDHPIVTQRVQHIRHCLLVRLLIRSILAKE